MLMLNLWWARRCPILSLGMGKNIAAARRRTLIKSVITSQAIFHITLLYLPTGTLLAINKIKKGFLLGDNRQSPPRKM
jgi:hypothetical protein